MLFFCDSLLFGFKPLGKGILLIYAFIMAVFEDGYIFLSRPLIHCFHLQITRVYNNIISHVITSNLADVAFKIRKKRKPRSAEEIKKIYVFTAVETRNLLLHTFYVH